MEENIKSLLEKYKKEFNHCQELLDEAVREDYNDDGQDWFESRQTCIKEVIRDLENILKS